MTSTQVYQLYIKADAQTIWDALTTPEVSAHYGYGGLADYDLQAGGAFRVRATPEQAASGMWPEVAVEGQVITVDQPTRLKQTWRFLFTPELAVETSQVTYGLTQVGPEVTLLTITHDLNGASATAAQVAGMGAGGGWAFVLSDLKSLLETGSSLGLTRG